LLVICYLSHSIYPVGNMPVQLAGREDPTSEDANFACVCEHVTLVKLAVLLVATLVGCLRYEMERVAISNLTSFGSDHPPNSNAAL